LVHNATSSSPHSLTEKPPVLDTYSGATRVIFIVGDPIAQVKSPLGVTRLLRQRGADAIVVPAHVKPADLATWMAAVRLMPNVDGVIVTVPHKFAALALADEATARARSIGASNVLRRSTNGGWLADMNDGDGYVAGLRKLGCEPRGKQALLVGAGGAGSAIAHALVDAGVTRLALHEADATRRETLAAKLRAYGPAVGNPVQPEVGSRDPGSFDLVINATPMGMKDQDPLPLDVHALQAGTFVGCVVTQPAVPPLIAAARAQGLATMTGADMFAAVCNRLVDFYLGA
jgi:shikimate dehydrogenase